MKSICFNYFSRWWFNGAIMMAGLALSTYYALAQIAPAVPTSPGSQVDKRLLGEWTAQGSYPDDKKGSMAITTSPDAYEKYRQLCALPSTWKPQPNDAVVIGDNGRPAWYLRCLNLKDGSTLILVYGGADSAHQIHLAQTFRFTPISPRLDVEYYSSIYPPMEFRLTKTAQQPQDSPGGLFDAQLLGKWEWADPQDRSLGYMEISVTPKAFEQFRIHEHFSGTWQPKPNEAVGLDAVGNAKSHLQYYVLADGTKALLVWKPDLEYYHYVDNNGPIKLDKISFLGTETVLLRKSNPQELQKVTVEDAKRAVSNNLHQLVSAAQTYMVDHDATQAKYSDIVGSEPDKPLRSIQSAAGERYDNIVIYKNTTQITVEVPGVGNVVYNL